MIGLVRVRRFAHIAGASPHPGAGGGHINATISSIPRLGWKPRLARGWPATAYRDLRTADTRLPASDFPHRAVILGQVAATTPEDSANWLHGQNHQIRSNSSSEQTFLLERASTAAYIAHQRAGNAAEEAGGWRCSVAAVGSQLAAGARCALAVARHKRLRPAASMRMRTSTVSGCWFAGRA